MKQEITMLNKFKSTLALSALALGLMAPLSSVHAAAVVCGDLSLGTRTTTVDPAMQCMGAGLGNLGDPDLLGLSYVDSLLDRDAANDNVGKLGITGVGGFSGTWSVSDSVWTSWQNVYLYFHFGGVGGGGAAYDPDYFIVRLSPVDVFGDWWVNPDNKGALSNVALLVGERRVPEPGTLVLLGISLAGISLIRRRRA